MKRVFMTFVGALAVTIAAHAQPVEAQTYAAPCGARDDLANKLKQRYDEMPSALGIASNGRLVEVFTSPNGTWTIVLTRPDGVSCLLAVGQDWQTMVRDAVDVES